MGLDLRINDLLVPFKGQTLRIEDQWGERSDLRGPETIRDLPHLHPGRVDDVRPALFRSDVV